MIRINLLPEGRRSAVTSNSVQVWGVVYLLSSFALCVVLFLLYLNSASALAEQRAKNGELQDQIDRTKAEAGDLADVEAQLARSRKLEEVADKLQSLRHGPTRLLMELSSILSVGGGPTVDSEVLAQQRRDNPLSGYNPGWDVRRLFLTEFREQAGLCQIKGIGRTNEDVAEFLRRLSLSELFDDVVLQSTVSQQDPDTQVFSVAFELTCRVRY